MATINHTRIATGNTKSVVVQWGNLANGDAGDALALSQYTDKSAQVTGNFGDGVLIIEGSNDGDNWFVLTDPQGNDLNISSAKIEQVTEATCYIRPRVTGTTGAAISVHLFIKE